VVHIFVLIYFGDGGGVRADFVRLYGFAGDNSKRFATDIITDTNTHCAANTDSYTDAHYDANPRIHRK